MTSTLSTTAARRDAKYLRVCSGLALVVLPFATGCTLATSSQSGSGPASPEEVASICDQTRSQILDLNGGDEVRLTQCEVQSDGNGGQVMVFGLNDYVEWTTLFSVLSFDDALFTVPLGVVASGFIGAGVEPTVFSRVIIAFQDERSTVYEIEPRDMADVLAAESSVQVGEALTALRDKIVITGLP